MKHSVKTASGTISFQAVNIKGVPQVELTAHRAPFPPISFFVTPEQAQAAHSGLGFVLEEVADLQISNETRA